MKKKILAIILSVIMLLSVVPITASAATVTGTCGENLTWIFDDGTLTISGTGVMDDYDYDECPWEGYKDIIFKVIIDNGVTTISNLAFCDCNNLTSVTIPDSVISIGDMAFTECTSLENISVDNDNQFYSSDECGVLFNKDKTTLIQYPAGNERTSYIIPNGVTTIGLCAFFSCTNLESVTFPDSLITIEYGAFYCCLKLASVTIPDSVTTIGDCAFDYCKSLTSIIIGDSVTTIGAYAFTYCDNLKSITIGDSVTTIGYAAFYDCDSLSDVYYLGTEEQWNAISIDNTHNGNDPLLNAIIHFNYNSHTHEYGEWNVVTEATCTETGLKTRICECGNAESEEIPATGHKYESTVTAPTCTEKGYTTYTCITCNDTYADNYVNAIGHADNDEDGYCDVCDELLCDHDCHRGGFVGFFWKISNFFNRLFGAKKYCSCGVAHY